MAKVYSAPTTAPAFDAAFVNGRFDNEAYDKQNADYIAQLAVLAKQNGNSPLLGEVIYFPRGDGRAEYMVWRTRPLELVWLELGDAWSVEDALIRGLRVSDIKKRVEADQRVRAIFGGTL